MRNHFATIIVYLDQSYAMFFCIIDGAFLKTARGEQNTLMHAKIPEFVFKNLDCFALYLAFVTLTFAEKFYFNLHSNTRREDVDLKCSIMCFDFDIMHNDKILQMLGCCIVLQTFHTE